MQKHILGLFVLVGGLGCGANAPGGGGSTDAPAGDDGGGTDAPADAPPDAPAPRCDVTKPFGTPTLLPGINDANRDIQAFLVDDLTLYWTTNRGGTDDLYFATRTSPTGTFGNPLPITGFSSTGSETAAVLTGDRLTMYYAYAPMGVAVYELYVATRANPSGVWGAGTPVTALNNAGSDEGDPTVTGDGTLVYFATDRNAGASGYDIWVGTRASNGTFSNVGPATELNSAAYDAHPRVTANGLTMYFSSMRTGGGALAGADVWMATRTSTSAAFGTPTRVAELNTNSNESPTWISDDGCVIYLQSNRPNNVGGQDIWEAVKPL